MAKNIPIIIPIICLAVPILIMVSRHFGWVSYGIFGEALCFLFIGIASFACEKILLDKL